MLANTGSSVAFWTGEAACVKNLCRQQQGLAHVEPAHFALHVHLVQSHPSEYKVLGIKQ
jgi:hypothetical protein